MRMSRPRAGGCDEAPTKLKLRVGRAGVEGLGQRPAASGAGETEKSEHWHPA